MKKSTMSQKLLTGITTASWNNSNQFLEKMSDDDNKFVDEIAERSDLDLGTLRYIYQMVSSAIIFSLAKKQKFSDDDFVAKKYIEIYEAYLVEVFDGNMKYLYFVIDNTPDMFSNPFGPAKIISLIYSNIVRDTEESELIDLASSVMLYKHCSDLLITEATVQADYAIKLKEYYFSEE